MYIHVCVYECMYVCIYVCMYVCTYVRTYVCLYVWVKCISIHLTFEFYVLSTRAMLGILDHNTGICSCLAPVQQEDAPAPGGDCFAYFWGPAIGKTWKRAQHTRRPRK